MTATRVRRVDEVAIVFNGKTPSKSEQRDSGHPVLKIKDVDALGRFRGTFSGHVGADFARKHVKRQLAGGETLVLNAAHNATHVASKTFYAAQEVAGSLATGEWLIVRWNTDTVDSRFGNHWINVPDTRFRIRRLVNGIHLYPKDVARLHIPLPPLAEQKRIAGILDAADALRAKRREALAELDTLLQSTFLDMFGDPVTNPMGWEVVELVSLIERGDKINYGVVQPGDDFPDGKPLIRVGDFVAGELVTSNLKLIDPAIEGKYQRSRLNGRELLISCVGSIGTVCTVPSEAEGFNIARAVARVPLVEGVDRDFMLHCLRCEAVQRHFFKETRTVSQPTLNIGLIKNAPVIQPPAILRNRFATIVESVEQQKTRQLAHLAELDTLFASLQSRAFRGDL